MAKKINVKETSENELMATERAIQKLKEIVNGSRKKVNDFIEKASKGEVEPKDYKIFIANKTITFYQHKCKNIYIIFAIVKNRITLVDFLTEIEFKDSKNKNSF